MQIGASDMAFARMSNFSFWLLPVAAILLTASFFAPGAAAVGWTLYAPLSLQMGPGMDLAIFAMYIMGAINIIVTVRTRAPSPRLYRAEPQIRFGRVWFAVLRADRLSRFSRDPGRRLALRGRGVAGPVSVRLRVLRQDSG